MKRSLIAVMLFLLLNVYGNVSALTLTGTDTILTNYEYGFDFINQVACTTFIYNPTYGCYNHFDFFYNSSIGQFELGSDGYGIQSGKINLDSIYTAPPDSSFKLSLHIDSIPQDSLSSYVGNSYIIKTGVDPRYSDIYFAKIRILVFRVIDSATHRIEMRFLWACNINNSRDIATSGLDTFNYSTSTIPSNSHKRPFTISSGQRVFKIIGDKFIIPKEFIGTVTNINIYSLSGKLLFNKPILNTNAIDLRNIKGISQNVLIARIEY